jgi:hypothetical protein
MDNSYCTVTELTDYLRIPDDSDAVELAAALNAASRGVDAWCRRRFYADTSATARTYRTQGEAAIYVDDIADTSGMIVAFDSVGAGTFTTVTTAYETWPLDGIGPNGQSGWPVEKIVAGWNTLWVGFTGFARMKVTAKWGWAAVPDDVAAATKQLAAMIFQQSAPAGGDFKPTQVIDSTASLNGALAIYRRYGVSR